jgi:enamine deaminase RidA (YjgF/YER057c/UK114 family)
MSRSVAMIVGKYTFALLACALVAAPALGKDVIRYKLPNSDFPIAQAVEVPAGQSIVFLSGAGPDVADKTTLKDSPTAYGDTKVQTLSALKNIETTLKSMGLGMGDVIKMQVFLVGDPAQGGKMDFAGLMESYRLFFGTKDQPNLPARSAMKVAGLANPGWLVEIEVTAVRK